MIVGVKFYISGVIISREYFFVKKLDDWKFVYGKVFKSEIIGEIVRVYFGNSFVVIEGDDNIDYVLYDKGEGGKYFSNLYVR